MIPSTEIENTGGGVCVKRIEDGNLGNPNIGIPLLGAAG